MGRSDLAVIIRRMRLRIGFDRNMRIAIWRWEPGQALRIW